MDASPMHEWHRYLDAIIQQTGGTRPPTAEESQFALCAAYHRVTVHTARIITAWNLAAAERKEVSNVVS